MAQNPIQLIAFDLDGTVLNSAKEVTPRTGAAINRALAAGIKIIPATGRQINDIPQLIKDCASPFVIANNGAQIYSMPGEELVFSRTHSTGQALSILAELREYRCLIYGGYEGTGAMDTKGRGAAAEIAERIAGLHRWKNILPQADLEKLLVEKEKAFVKLVVFFDDPQERQRVFESFRPRKDLYVTFFESDNIEILPAGINKGAALKFAAEKLGIAMKNVMALGDSDNDREMLLEAGWGIAMGNAHDDVRAAAKKTTLGCDEDGAALAIEEALN
jgi:Cof subfamily protein (haloacid dehalogenase superfamily)